MTHKRLNMKKSIKSHPSFDVDAFNRKLTIQKYYYQLQEYKNTCLQTFCLDYFNKLNSNPLPYHVNMAMSKYTIFDDPNLFALSKKHEIYFTKNYNLHFDKNNYHDRFLICGYCPPASEFINSLYEILSLRNKTDPHWIYTNYKYKNKGYTCIFDQLDLFRIFDENLIFDESPVFRNGSSIKSSYHTLLNEKTSERPVLTNNLHTEFFPKLKQPSLPQLKAIFTLLRNSKLERDTEQKHPLQDQMEYILAYLLQHQLVKFPDINLRDKPFTIPNNRQNILSSNAIPPNVIGILDHLTSGNVESLSQLATLIAKVNLTRGTKQLIGISPKLTVIMTPNPEIIKTFFAQLYKQPSKNCKSIHTLRNKKSIIENILFKYNGGILQVYNHTNSVSIEDLKFFKKLVRSIPILIPDKVAGSLKYISNCHYVVIVNKQEDARIYQNFFQNLAEIINLNSHTDKLQQGTIDFRLSKLECEWVHTILATHGLLCLDKEKHRAPKKQSRSDADVAILSFLEECCIFEPNADCYAYKLYEIFSKYIIKNYGVEPIKKLHLIEKLKKNKRLIYCRPRHRATEHGWGFRGITIKKEKWDEYFNENISSHSHQVNYKVAEYLKEIDRTVRPLLGI